MFELPNKISNGAHNYISQIRLYWMWKWSLSLGWKEKLAQQRLYSFGPIASNSTHFFCIITKLYKKKNIPHGNFRNCMLEGYIFMHIRKSIEKPQSSSYFKFLIKQFSQERSKLSTMPLKCYFNSERTDHKKATNGSYYLHDKSICCRRGLLALLL